MRKRKKLTFVYHYVGNESPEKKKEADERLQIAYSRIFQTAFENLKNQKHVRKER